MSNIAAIAEQAGASQAEVHREVGLSRSAVSRLWSGSLTPSKDTIDRLLAFFTRRLGRAVTYEEAFGKPKKHRKGAGRAA